MLFKRHISQLLQTQVVLESSINDGGDLRTIQETFSEYSPLTKDFDSLVHNGLQHYHVSGLAVAIVHEGQTFSKGYGVARFPNTPVTPETLFYGASTTKAFVAAAISLLIDDNKGNQNITWTTPISELLRDDFVLSDELTTLQVTLQDAATHRTGLPRHDLSIRGGNQTVKDLVRSMRHLPLTKPLRTTFQYCNLMYATLGHVVETFTGEWLGNLLRRRIWTPLNMTSTYFTFSDALRSGKLAKGYVWLRFEKEFKELDWVDEIASAGAGAVVSSVLDYSKWVRMMIDRDLPISKAGHEALTSPHMIQEKNELTGSNLMYGYGWELMNYRGYEIVFHDGSINGFGSNVLFIPAKKWGCVMMSNTDLTSNILEDVLTWNLVDDLLETPHNLRLNRTKIYDTDLAYFHKFANTTLVREIFYPSDKLANISTSLPLSDYAGTFSNPGYGLWHIQYENNTLWNRVDRKPVFSWMARLEHLYSDRFLTIAYTDDSPEDPLYFEAEFIVDWEGKVEKLGLYLEDEMINEKIWFDKVK